VANLPTGYSGGSQHVIVHATISNDGKVEEAEALQNSDPGLGQAALAHVRRSNYPANNPGNRPLEQEAFINVRFTPAH
jgi:hypothetical protein